MSTKLTKTTMQDLVRKELQGLTESELKDLLARMTAKTKTPKAEYKPVPKDQDPVFPDEFLDSILETAFHTLHNYLKKIGAKEQAWDLLDVMYVLNQNRPKDGEKVKYYDNENMQEYIAEATQFIVALGGVFHTENGSTIPRAR